MQQVLFQQMVRVERISVWRELVAKVKNNENSGMFSTNDFQKNRLMSGKIVISLNWFFTQKVFFSVIQSVSRSVNGTLESKFQPHTKAVVLKRGYSPKMQFKKIVWWVEKKIAKRHAWLLR